MMKRIVYILILFLGISACSKQPKRQAKLSIEINGIENDTLYLLKEENDSLALDTLVANANKINQKVKVDSFALATLLYKEKQYPIYLFRGDKINIVGDTASFDFLNVKGNLSNNKLTSILDTIHSKKQLNIKEYLKKEIKANSDFIGNIYLLRKYIVNQASFNLKEGETIIRNLHGTLKDNPYISSLSDKIDELKRSRVNNYATSFSAKDSTGKRFSRNSFYGKFLLIHFWSTYQKSLNEIDTLKLVYRKHKKDKDFAMMSVCLDANQTKWKEIIRSKEAKWLQLIDRKEMNSRTYKNYGILEFPSTYILNNRGRIVAKNIPVDSIQTVINLKLKKYRDSKKPKR